MHLLILFQIQTLEILQRRSRIMSCESENVSIRRHEYVCLTIKSRIVWEWYMHYSVIVIVMTIMYQYTVWSLAAIFCHAVIQHTWPGCNLNQCHIFTILFFPTKDVPPDHGFRAATELQRGFLLRIRWIQSPSFQDCRHNSHVCSAGIKNQNPVPRHTRI